MTTKALTDVGSEKGVEVLAWAKAWVALWGDHEGDAPKVLTFHEPLWVLVPLRGPDGQVVDGPWGEKLLGVRVTIEPLPYVQEMIELVRACRDGVIGARWDAQEGRGAPAGLYDEKWWARRGREALGALAALRAQVLDDQERLVQAGPAF